MYQLLLGDFIFVSRPPRFFYIRSRLHGKVMDINKGKEKEGGGIIVYKQNDHPSDNQLWYEDRRGIIRSKLKNFCLEAGQFQIVVSTDLNYIVELGISGIN